MKHHILLTAVFLFSVVSFTSGQSRKLPIDTTVVTQHSVTINGTPLSYTAKIGTQPVWDELGTPIAYLHYT
jgi:carboxypeptidase C (cathepsin A)